MCLVSPSASVLRLQNNFVEPIVCLAGLVAAHPPWHAALPPLCSCPLFASHQHKAEPIIVTHVD